jgi:Cys-rich repeat protein
MQRSHLLRWLALAIGLLGTQCLDSISDDCTKTLTCEDDQQPTLRENCEWRYPNGALWPGAPHYDEATRKWRWPDGKETATQDFDCNRALADAGTDAGPAGPDCRANITCDEGQVCDPATGGCVQCASDTDCAGNMPMGDAGAATVCDTAIHRCVECLGNQNCSGDTGVCKRDEANSRRNACVECVDDTTCDTATPICDERANDCTSTCQSAADCTGDKKACNTTRNICVECTANGDCTSGNELLCDTESNLCVECLNDVPCAADGKVCDLQSHTCVECQIDEQCLTPGRSLCDAETKQCVECLNDQQCTIGTASRCNAAHVCTGCTSDSQCEGGGHCRSGACVECLNPSHCTDVAEPVCETTQGICVGCLENGQCRSEEAAHCEIDPEAPAGTLYTCVPCVGNADCTGDGKDLPPLCNPTRSGGTCSQCITEGDCFDSGPLLSRCLNGTCSICSEDAQCSLFAGPPSNTPACKSGFGCVECTESTDCTDTPATPVCKLAAGGGTAAINTCVQCVDNAGCSANPAAPLCQNNQCVPCSVDADCNDVNDSNGNLPGGAELSVCDAGTCVECTGVKRDNCGVNVCNSLTKVCEDARPARSAALCDPCVSDFECAEDARCVQQTSGGTSIGFFCVPLPTGTPASCNPRRPFAGATQLNTLDTPGLTSVCTLRQTTCPGLDDRTEDCDLDTNCGAPNVADGLCVEFGGGNVCTIPCISEFDCNVGADCTSGGCEL